jgi:hypothetical protein
MNSKLLDLYVYLTHVCFLRANDLILTHASVYGFYNLLIPVSEIVNKTFKKLYYDEKWI